MALDLDDLLGGTPKVKETVVSEETPKIKETVTDDTKKPVSRGRKKVKETVSGDNDTTGDKAEGEKKVVLGRGGKPKQKPRGGNSPVIGNNGLELQPGDNAKFMEIQIALLNMPNIDMNDVEQVTARLSEYFALYTSRDMKPTVAGMAVALNGHSRQWLHAVVHDKPSGGAGYKAALPTQVADCIKKAYSLLENLWESYMQNGKVNPVAGIFLGKNNYGYLDKTEYVLTPNQQATEDYDPTEIRERYIAADQQKRLTDNSTDPED